MDELMTFQFKFQGAVARYGRDLIRMNPFDFEGIRKNVIEIKRLESIASIGNP